MVVISWTRTNNSLNHNQELLVFISIDVNLILSSHLLSLRLAKLALARLANNTQCSTRVKHFARTFNLLMFFHEQILNLPLM